MMQNQHHQKQGSQSNKKYVKWKLSQDLLYAYFIEQNYDALISESSRRSNKVFSMMSKFIPTKNADQCRTHHSKMIKGSGSIQNILLRIDQRKIKDQKRQQTLKRSLGKRGRPPTNRNPQMAQKLQKQANIDEMISQKNQKRFNEEINRAQSNQIDENKQNKCLEIPIIIDLSFQ